MTYSSGGAIFCALPTGGTNGQTYPIRYKYPTHPELNPTNSNLNDLIFNDIDLFQNMLLDPRSRNFFYYGHGDRDLLAFGIHASVLYANVMHRYRFVWLDGCETGTGTWPKVFGITERNVLPLDYYATNWIRPGLFVGNQFSVPIGVWKGKNAYQVGDAKYDGYIPRCKGEFYIQFVFYWSLQGESYKKAVQDAHNLVQGAYFDDPMIYDSGPKQGQKYWGGDDQVRFGYEDLRINEYNGFYDIPIGE